MLMYKCKAPLYSRGFVLSPPIVPRTYTPTGARVSLALPPPPCRPPLFRKTHVIMASALSASTSFLLHPHTLWRRCTFLRPHLSGSRCCGIPM
ncbi:unnamed protein product [Ixodes pacificus]